jgi:ABC-2 type transport system permease protein
MVWRAIARKEIRDLLRPRTGKAGLTLVAMVFVMGGYLLPTAVENPTTTEFTDYMTQAVVLVIPLFGLLLGYKTIVAERVSGRMTLLLSLPHSRGEAVVGKFVGRFTVLVAVVAGGVLLGSALAAYPFGTLEPWVLAGYIAVTLLYAVAFLGIGVALSTLTRSTGITTAATFGVFFLFVVVWTTLRVPLLLALEWLGAATNGLPDWALFVHGLEPTMLYRRVLDGVVQGTQTGPYLGPDAAWYLGPGPGLVLLGAWSVVPVGLGYLRFRRTDL